MTSPMQSTSLRKGEGRPPRALVAWGSRLGGTEGIARAVADALAGEGFSVTRCPAARAGDPTEFDAVIVGGALYANRWQRDARRFVARNVRRLRRVPVWFFSSGPLDDSAERGPIPPPPQVSVLMERIGALGHVTFGGRLQPGTRGFPASAMARTMSGDFRNFDSVQAWAREVARAIPSARPRTPVEPAGRSFARLIAHAFAGWATCAAVMGGLLQVASSGVAAGVHALFAPLIFTLISVSYFRARGAREPLPTALAFVAIVALLDATVVAGLILGSFAMFASFVGTWLPLLLIGLATWMTGFVASTLPWPKGARETDDLVRAP